MQCTYTLAPTTKLAVAVCAPLAADGSIVEVFEWRSHEAIEQAHSNPAVQELWEEFGAVCNFTSLAELPESKNRFAEFDAIDLLHSSSLTMSYICRQAAALPRALQLGNHPCFGKAHAR